MLTALDADATASPDTFLFVTRGSVLIRADDASVAAVVEKVLTHHRTTVFAPGIETVRFGTRVTRVGSRVVSLSGHLGAFRVQFETSAGRSDGGSFSPNGGGSFDLVLDLCADPICKADAAPLGYFAPGTDPGAIDAAVTAMRSLTGRFTKPRYFQYQPDLCAHGASGITGCTRCLEVCSADAITSLGPQIRVDAALCQGCASCALACPSGALSLRYPARVVLEDQLRLALAGALPAVALIVHEGAPSPAIQHAVATGVARSMRVDPLSAFGDELWLRALALGARAVLLVEEQSMHLKSRATIADRVVQVHALLAAVGQPRERVKWVSADQLQDSLAVACADTVEDSDRSSRSRPALSQAAGKRGTSLEAISVLESFRCTTAAATALPPGAAFGEVAVDTGKCTLCFACTQLCPTGALIADRGATQRLSFRESACLQCNLCVQGCPEQAMALRPRLAPAALTADEPVVLHQDEQLCCSRCSSPYISRRLLESSLMRLRDSQALSARGREALRTCPACRQQEMIGV